MNISAEDIAFAKEMTNLKWTLTRSNFLPAEVTEKEEQLLGEVSREFAQKCILDVLSLMKPEFLRSQQPTPPSSESKSSEDLSPQKPINTPCLSDAYRLNFVQNLRPSVMILGAGWKATESMHVTFVEVQGMSLRKVSDHLLRNKANWHQVGQVMLLPDAMWSWRGNLHGLNDFVSILRQRSPLATIYLCGIPIYDSAKIEPWQLHWIKLFNQYVFKMCAAAASQQLQVFYMGKFIKEHKNDWQPSKPYYPKPEIAAKIVNSLVRVFEHLAEKRLGINIASLQLAEEDENFVDEDID